MWVGINRWLKQASPSAHTFLKDRFAKWRTDCNPLIPVPKRIRGEFFWVHPRLLAAESADHEPHIYEWIINSLPARGVLFDVGAHYGWISLNAARHVGRYGRVVAFEASPVLINLLRYHQRYNRLPQMTVSGSAVSESDSDTADFYLLNGGLSSRNSLTIARPGLPFLESTQRMSVKVPTMKLDTFSESTGLTPNVIKIDVEGAEGMVLRGASATLRRFHPVLIVSIHPFWLPSSDSTARILEFTQQYGYHVRDSHVASFEGYELSDYLLSP